MWHKNKQSVDNVTQVGYNVTVITFCLEAKTMAKETIRSRVDSDTKDKAQAIFESLGLSMSDAIRMFLKQSVLEKGLPFQVKLPNDAAYNQWFIREVEAAVREADLPGATFIPHEEMVSKWVKKRQELLAQTGETSEQ